ncbi:GNAT family N-acetyltransferase [Leptolyngbya iicbica LK]|uniref:GNAT family N-acetyltransferase n=2 Tax=Cyanophyceae TaxID=3028117 RepID=A0A4Q7E3R0_9CYAN|nr:GNAT family N-acetyltransferase [Leptolyngbya sp. LK]RZM77326.1 GNAT family N-acetyltransferase [Leptolyngbya sp. LK]
MKIDIHGPSLGQARTCAPILRALPEWFGIEAATQEYIRDIEQQPTLVAWVNDQPVGFLTLTRHNPVAAEIHVMGILPAYHRRGIGRSLVIQAEAHLRQQGVQLLQVKTVGADVPSEPYAHTREFYTAMGFLPLQVFPTLWGAANPCLQLVKWLGD